MSTIPSQSSLVTDDQAYTVDCAFCSAKPGEPCINVRSVIDTKRQPQYYSAGVHKARIKAYKALNNVEGIEPATAAKLVECVKPEKKPKTDEDIIYTHIDGLEEPLPVKAKTVEIRAVINTSEKAIQVVNSDQYTAWIPKSVIITSERNKLFIQLNFDISWYKSFTQ